ncbi:MAG: HD domain-containing protein [Myxococcales bacterium]|nr:HD domain-containing protein [Myxococcales bacterium]
MSLQEPNHERALEALEWAAKEAEGGSAGAPPTIVLADDYRRAAELVLPDLRVRLDRVMMATDAERGLDALLTCGALSALLPPVKEMVGFSDGEWRHKDVWKHTKQVVRQATAKLEVRWAALLHDIGKVKTRSIAPDGEVHFFGHAEVGARMFDRMERRVSLFRGEPALRDAVRFLILHHLRASQYSADWTDSAVRRFGREMGDRLPDLLCLSRADITTKRPERRRKGLQQIEDLALRVASIAELDAREPPLPSGIGNEIMRVFGLPPSRRIGELKSALEQAVAAGEVPPHEPFETYLAFLEQNRARFGLG